MAHGKLFIDTSVERELKVVVIGDLEAARQQEQLLIPAEVQKVLVRPPPNPSNQP